MAEVDSVCQFLKSQGFHFLNSWVSECVNYFKTNNPSISLEVLKEEVRQQWLLLNLREVKLGAFPADLALKPKVVLPGKYAVQVETLVDSGQSRYGQFQSIINYNLENIQATAKPLEVENIARRCLTMTVTDGVQELSAMEYGPIPSLKLLDPNLLPGFKMIIKGPVMCRRGMLMLEAGNVEVCGGEVDTLAESNKLDTLLAKSLGLDANPSRLRPATNLSNARDNILLSEAGDDVLLDVPFDEPNFPNIASNHNSLTGTPCEDFSPRTTTNSLPLESTVSAQELFDNDPFGDDDILMCVPESITSGPPTTSRSSTKEIAVKTVSAKKQTSMNNFLSKALPTTKSKLPDPIRPAPKTQYISSSPFVYLAQVIDGDLLRDTEFKVKAYIITLKTKATIKDNAFSLRAQICDGSLSIDVNFSSQIIQDFLGFSPSEVQALVKERAVCSSKTEILKSAFATLQTKLIALNAILTIRFFVSKSLPLVVKVEEPMWSHLSALTSRSVN